MFCRQAPQLAPAPTDVTLQRTAHDSGISPTLKAALGSRDADYVDIVLAVDDNPRNLDVIEAALAREPWKLQCATSGQQALKMAAAEVPDVVLLDVMMPGMDGIAVCKALKSNPLTAAVPVLLVTALDSQDDRVRGLDAGADDFVTKPFYPTELRARVRAHLRVRAMQRRLEDRELLLRQLFARYVSDDVAAALLRDPALAGLGVKRARLAVLFADLRGFTTVTETESAESVAQVLNQTFEALTAALLQHNGTFDKFIGDCLMAFFGAPIARADDLQRAVAAAQAMQCSFALLRASWAGTAFADLGLGIGVHVGEAVVGNIGTERLMDYTAIGDTVNLAARLEEMAGKGETLVSQDVADGLGDTVVLKSLGPTPIRGRAKPITIYAVQPRQ